MASRPTPLTPWRRLLEAFSLLERLFEDELQRDCGIPLSWYDVLIHLWEAGGSLRMSELADAVVLSRSWLTRRVESMERAGLVRRCPASGDGRGVCAELTEHGGSTYRAAERSHARSIRKHFLAHLDADETALVEQLMTRVAGFARSSLEEAPPAH
jgi:DNA-binding MarR family transcriptional regulator